MLDLHFFTLRRLHTRGCTPLRFSNPFQTVLNLDISNFLLSVDTNARIVLQTSGDFAVYVCLFAWLLQCVRSPVTFPFHLRQPLKKRANSRWCWVFCLWCLRASSALVFAWSLFKRFSSSSVDETCQPYSCSPSFCFTFNELFLLLHSLMYL